MRTIISKLFFQKHPFCDLLIAYSAILKSINFVPFAVSGVAFLRRRVSFCKISVLIVFLFLSFEVSARPVKWQGKRITKSVFLKLYKEHKQDLYVFNTQVLSIKGNGSQEKKAFPKPERGAYGVFSFKVTKGHKDRLTRGSLYIPSAVATCRTPDGRYFTACVEWWMEIIRFEGKTTTREAVGVYIGTMKYKGKRIPIIKCCPKITLQRFKQYLYELEEKREGGQSQMVNQTGESPFLKKKEEDLMAPLYRLKAEGRLIKTKKSKKK